MHDLRSRRGVPVYVERVWKKASIALDGVLELPRSVETDILAVAREEVPPAPASECAVGEIVDDPAIIELEPYRVQGKRVLALHREVRGERDLDVLYVLHDDRHLGGLLRFVEVRYDDRGEQPDDLDDDEKLEKREAGYADATDPRFLSRIAPPWPC